MIRWRLLFATFFYVEHHDNFFQKHIQVCKFSQVRCSYWQYGCLAKLVPEEVEDHEESCLFRPIECEQCGRPMQDQGVR